MFVVAPGELIITGQARWLVTVELLETSLRLSWSPVGAPETSRAPKSDAKSLSDANLSSQSAFFWVILTFLLALKKLLGSSLGAANGSLRVHNHLIDSMDRNVGALEDLLEALLVAFRSSWRPP